MITPEQLAEIKHEMEKGDSLEPSFALELIAMIECLTATLTARNRVLSQFADSENWVVTPPAEDESFYDFSYVGSGNPIHIANQALSEGKE